MEGVVIVTCSTCGNLILPGDTIACIVRGTLGIASDAIEVHDDQKGKPFYTCEDCTRKVVETLDSVEQFLREREAAACQFDTESCCGACIPDLD